MCVRPTVWDYFELPTGPSHTEPEGFLTSEFQLLHNVFGWQNEIILFSLIGADRTVHDCWTCGQSFYSGGNICSHSSSAEWATAGMMVFETGQVLWGTPWKALDKPTQQRIVFFPWTFRWKLCEHHMHFFYIGMLCGMWNINTWALAWKITVLSCLCQRGAWMEQLLKGSSAEADGLGQNIFHSISALSEDWDPADQSHKQITINKLNGESQRLENGDERQAFKEERTLNNKQ